MSKGAFVVSNPLALPNSATGSSTVHKFSVEGSKRESLEVNRSTHRPSPFVTAIDNNFNNQPSGGFRINQLSGSNKSVNSTGRDNGATDLGYDYSDNESNLFFKLMGKCCPWCRRLEYNALNREEVGEEH